MTDDEADWPCVPWTGRRLWTLRARYTVLRVADRWCHRLHLHDHASGIWPCWELENVYYAGLFMHDQREHDRVMARTQPGLTAAPNYFVEEGNRLAMYGHVDELDDADLEAEVLRRVRNDDGVRYDAREVLAMYGDEDD